MTAGRSLRLRLALGSAALAGVALAGFAAAAWWQVSQARISTLDRALCDQTERELSRNWPADHWAPHERVMGRTLGARSPADALLLVQEGGSLVYRSGHWPATLDPDTLPWPSPADRPDRPDTLAPPPSPGGHGAVRDDRRGPPSADGRDHAPGPGPDPARRREEPGGPHGAPPRAPISSCVTRTLTPGAARWRFGLAATPDTRLAVGVDLAVIDADLMDLRAAFLLALPLAFGLITLGAWFLSGRALAPLRRLTLAMAGITAKGLDRRISAANTVQELYELIQVFNGMLERLERGFRQASRFSADAAHELKTPLAILQMQIEQALAEAEAGSSLQERLTGILDEVQRLGTIARKLLLLSLADAGRLSLNRTPCDLSQALEDLLEDAQMLAPGLRLHGSVAPDLRVRADAPLLKQVLHNLLANAVKYNRPHGFIRLTAGRRAGRITVAITNASVDLAPADRARLFERFYRTDPARQRGTEGAGLGLSLAREIARAHGGDLVLADPTTGETQFLLLLPADDTPE
ncbi:ATP-binding protein [uncultured Thiodictyon sp.]|uniref:ATP-binding protein n=1 Tax=uncultured Thiodictyon sp. TaxID=1846217 RepID=UPI0025EAFED0|nr:ATP-binding protein [uncultured Thiodictyon sp.]